MRVIFLFQVFATSVRYVRYTRGCVVFLLQVVTVCALTCLWCNGLGITRSKGRFKLIYTLKRLSGENAAKQEVNSANPIRDRR